MDKFSKAFYNYLEVYLSERDLEKTIKLTSEKLSGYGTGLGEKVKCPEDVFLLYKNDIGSAPNRIDYQVNNLSINLLSENIALVSCELNLETEILKQKINFNELRLSMVFNEINYNILIEHLHLSFPTSEHGEEEAFPLKELSDRMEALKEIFFEETKSLRDAYSKLVELVEKDKLTGIYNRYKADEILLNELNRSKRYNRIFSLILIDIDNFKNINDDLGHLEGDRVLKIISNILKGNIRNTDFCARWGGEEFLIVLPETGSTNAHAIAEFIRKTIEKFDFEIKRNITVSIGITTSVNSDTIDSIFKRADEAMYLSKKEGKNKISIM